MTEEKKDEIDLSKVTDEEIMDEVYERGLEQSFYDEFMADLDPPEDDSVELEKIWLAFRDKECPQVLKDYIWNKHGKIL